ncbi:MucBP domain-containing protein [Listeria booriae]|uniref:MucBP domain-containing protein n=1 Tax=Listeria booriae TaxID=1552123 RepID=UPI0016263C6B|nr:MucBP domain-containing protein [Listeria booriae]MBC1803296.1 LPXTG cell wall anchor domain-containing protein [Listeria booriae]
MTQKRGTKSIAGMLAVLTGVSLLAPVHPVAVTTQDATTPLSASTVTTPSEEAVQDWMPDADLRRSVRLALGFTDENQITKESMQQLTTLEDISARSLTGLEYAVNLRSMDIGFSQDFEGKPHVYKSNITDFSPLYNLHNLQFVALSGDFSGTLLEALFSHVPTVTRIYLYNNAVLQDLNWMNAIPSNHAFTFALMGGGFWGDEVQVSDFSGLDNRSLDGIRIHSSTIKNIPASTFDPNNIVALFHGQVSDYSRLGDMQLVDISAQDIRHVPAKIVGDRVIAKNPIRLPDGFPAMARKNFGLFFLSYDTTTQEMSIDMDTFALAHDNYLQTSYGYTYNRDGKIFNAGGTIIMDVEAPPVTVRYLDSEGKSIHADSVLIGLYTDPYTSTAASVPGYTLKETPANASGTYSEKAQTVTYIYEKIATQPVTVQYVDEQGFRIAPAEILTGDYEKPYASEAKTISGYTLTETPGNATGVFTEQAQTVTYVYHKQTAQPVTVQYVDESGASIAAQETLTGEFGKAYTSKAKDLAGYVLLQTPTNATGVFTEQAQTVRYRYQKTPELVSGTDPNQPNMPTTEPEGSPSTQQPSTSGSTGQVTSPISSVATPTLEQAHPLITEATTTATQKLPTTGDRNTAPWPIVAGVSALLVGAWLLRRKS